MKNLNLTTRTLALASGLGLALAFPVMAAEKPLALKDAPAAVQKTVADQLKGGKLKSLSVETEGGKTEYEAEVTVDGRDKTVAMDASGKVLETEMVVDLKALPEAVRAGLTREAGKGSIAKVEEVTKAGVTSYEAKITEAGKKDREVVVTADGKLVAPRK
jgi:uncharacterized membrane protein YkoI